jgi:hypothetical protein
VEAHARRESENAIYENQVRVCVRVWMDGLDGCGDPGRLSVTYTSNRASASMFQQSKFQAAASGRLEEVERLKAEVQALDEVFQTDTDYEHASYKVQTGSSDSLCSLACLAAILTQHLPRLFL